VRNEPQHPGRRSLGFVPHPNLHGWSRSAAALSIVLYNGRPRWTAVTGVLDLIEPAPGQLRDYAPRLKYLLLDEGPESGFSMPVDWTRYLATSDPWR
jgi:hypothetical protein